MSEPIGWNVYASASERDITLPPRFIKFVPNEPALAAESARMADEVERQLEDGTL